MSRPVGAAAASAPRTEAPNFARDLARTWQVLTLARLGVTLRDRTPALVGIGARGSYGADGLTLRASARAITIGAINHETTRGRRISDRIGNLSAARRR